MQGVKWEERLRLKPTMEGANIWYYTRKKDTEAKAERYFKVLVIYRHIQIKYTKVNFCWNLFITSKQIFWY